MKDPDKKIYQGINKTECYYCGFWACMSKTGKCPKCGTQNDPPQDLRMKPFSQNSSAYRKSGRRSGVKANLTPEIVREIRKKHEEGISSYRIAEEHGISPSMAHGIISGKYWKEVKDE